METPNPCDLDIKDPTEVAEAWGVEKTGKMYNEALHKSLGKSSYDKILRLCMKYIEFEKMCGEIDFVRGLYASGAAYADPELELDFWNQLSQFELESGNEETFRKMLRMKRTMQHSFHPHH